MRILRVAAWLMVVVGVGCGDNGKGAAPPPDAPSFPDGLPAFRFSELALRDPHVTVQITTCADAGPVLVDNAITDAVKKDDVDDADSLLDLSVVMVFPKLTQAAGTQPIEIHIARCTSPLDSTTCSPGDLTINTTVTNLSAEQCLTFFPGTVKPYDPPVTSTAAPCFVTEPIALNVSLLGIPFNLQKVQLAGTYNGDPATTVSSGLLRGFLTETIANATTLPNLPLVGGKPLSEVLPGGANNCAPSSDKDMEDGAPGWWFYLNFQATRVSWKPPVCGDGAVEFGEDCDTAVAAGSPGACPASCNDNIACTTDTLAGAGCLARCTFERVVSGADSDSCCPPNTGSGEDIDCTASLCGNGFLEGEEICDDGRVITPNCTPDCQLTCGNRRVDTMFPDQPPESDELCDIGITSGPGACPTLESCNDNDACTQDLLLNEGGCNAICQHGVISVPVPDDGCCPPGEDSTTDNDCPAPIAKSAPSDKRTNAKIGRARGATQNQIERSSLASKRVDSTTKSPSRIGKKN